MRGISNHLIGVGQRFCHNAFAQNRLCNGMDEPYNVAGKQSWSKNAWAKRMIMKCQHMEKQNTSRNRQISKSDEKKNTGRSESTLVPTLEERWKSQRDWRNIKHIKLQRPRWLSCSEHAKLRHRITTNKNYEVRNRVILLRGRQTEQQLFRPLIKPNLTRLRL